MESEAKTQQQKLIKSLSTSVLIKLFWIGVFAQGIILFAVYVTQPLVASVISFATMIGVLYVVIRLYTKHLLELLEKHPQYGTTPAVRRLDDD